MDASLASQSSVIDNIAFRYNISSGNVDIQTYYTAVTFAGFNYVDEVCASYLESLFIRDRRKNRAKDIITASITTSTAILTAAEVTGETIGYVATSLGFASNVFDIVQKSYLYEMKPSLIFGIEQELQRAFRKQAAEAAITNRAAAVYWLRGYLSLCFPMTIEAKVDEALSAAKAETKGAPGKQEAWRGPASLSRTRQGLPAMGVIPDIRLVTP